MGKSNTSTLGLVSDLSLFIFCFELVIFVEIYCVITTALWSRDGAAVVSVHPPAASVGSGVRFL